MAVNGHYIGDADVSNWPDGMSDAAKLVIIKSVEERIHKLTKDFFYPKVFGKNLDGNGENILNLNLIPNILSVTSVKISGVALSTSYYTHDNIAVYLDSTSITSEVELRYMLKRSQAMALFPVGFRNIEVIGTYGWSERLDIDNVSGIFQVGEEITAPSGASATITEVEDDYVRIAGRSTTDFSNDEEITGGTSEATADVNNASGAVVDPPDGIKEACVIVASYRNDDTLYTPYTQGSESSGGVSVTTKLKPLTGLREADELIRPYVRKKLRALVV
jgi:hypothetical protein